MGGKAILILVLGFTIIFLVMGYFWGGLATRSVDNHVSYYDLTEAHNLAVSGANLALQQIYSDSTWVAGYSGLSMSNGVINVDIQDIAGDMRKVTSTGTYPAVNGIDQKVVVKLKNFSWAKFAYYNGQNMNSKDFVTGDTLWALSILRITLMLMAIRSSMEKFPQQKNF